MSRLFSEIEKLISGIVRGSGIEMFLVFFNDSIETLEADKIKVKLLADGV